MTAAYSGPYTFYFHCTSTLLHVIVRGTRLITCISCVCYFLCSLQNWIMIIDNSIENYIFCCFCNSLHLYRILSQHYTEKLRIKARRGKTMIHGASKIVPNAWKLHGREKMLWRNVFHAQKVIPIGLTREFIDTSVTVITQRQHVIAVQSKNIINTIQICWVNPYLSWVNINTKSGILSYVGRLGSFAERNWKQKHDIWKFIEREVLISERTGPLSKMLYFHWANMFGWWAKLQTEVDLQNSAEWT